MVVRFIPVGTTCGHQLVRTISFGSCIFTAMTKTPKVTNLIRDEVYFGSSWFQRLQFTIMWSMDLLGSKLAGLLGLWRGREHHGGEILKGTAHL